ncbi:DUF3253 domain-containing protein [Pedobacter sp. KBS0701]|uniref:DUF3253 domain-containing protein n=1 Tax=Pedobacter sp. KBS0701 TaxID=2578106 RepID=UPI00110E308D|nr:DUF3253 domain-containing protein [Pedobacter sp. KBS0701]QDW23947.1 DUF3253 domain-containing protein [Pedobacter sp. KBS0701]
MKIPISHQTKQADIQNTILSLATERGPGKSTCPSEIARLLFPQEWRNQMKAVRDVAIDLHKQGRVVITQKGKPVDIDRIKGPIRIKMV